MISVIYGSKGSGKTKAIIERANNSLENAKGAVVYLSDTKEHRYQIKYTIRYVMTKDYDIYSLDSFIGFLSGMVAGNHDIEYIFIDGAARISCTEINGLGKLFEFMEKYPEINFILTVSSDYDNLPQFIKKHIA